MNRRDILRAIALGGGVVAGELWWPKKRVISIVPTELRFKAVERYSPPWFSTRDGVGLFSISHCMVARYTANLREHLDATYLSRDGITWTGKVPPDLSEESLEQLCIDILESEE